MKDVKLAMKMGFHKKLKIFIIVAIIKITIISCMFIHKHFDIFTGTEFRFFYDIHSH